MEWKKRELEWVGVELDLVELPNKHLHSTLFIQSLIFSSQLHFNHFFFLQFNPTAQPAWSGKNWLNSWSGVDGRERRLGRITSNWWKQRGSFTNQFIQPTNSNWLLPSSLGRNQWNWIVGWLVFCWKGSEWLLPHQSKKKEEEESEMKPTNSMNCPGPTSGAIHWSWLGFSYRADETAWCPACSINLFLFFIHQFNSIKDIWLIDWLMERKEKIGWLHFALSLPFISFLCFVLLFSSFGGAPAAAGGHNPPKSRTTKAKPFIHTALALQPSLNFNFFSINSLHEDELMKEMSWARRAGPSLAAIHQLSFRPFGRAEWNNWLDLLMSWAVASSIQVQLIYLISSVPFLHQ